MVPPDYTKLEDETREEIDQKLINSGWVIQDKKKMNLMAGDYGVNGVAIREMDTDTGPADYMLFIAGKACGIIEAKREGSNLGLVAEQSARYATSQTKHIERWVAEDKPLPFLYEASNHEIRVRDERDPKSRSRYVFHFHRPETIKNWLEQGDSLRARMLQLPELNKEGLRACQIDTITGIEKSLKQANPRALLQMGEQRDRNCERSGKTFTACTEVYRLAKFAKAKRDLNTMGVIPVGVEKKFFWYWFLALNLGSLSDGSNVPQINHGDIEPLPVPIAPPEQQKRIVAKIEELFSHIDAGIAALKKAKQLLKQYHQSVLKAAVTGELTKEWREANKAKLESASQLLERTLKERRQKSEEQQLEQFKAKGKIPKEDKWKEKYKAPEELELIFDIPKGWAATTISQVAECIDSIKKPVSKKERLKRAGNIPYDGANGLVGFIDDYLFDEPLVLVVEDETFVGRTLPFSYKIEGKSWVNNYAHVLRASDAVMTDYLNYSFMYYPFTPLTTGSTSRRKLTQKALNSAPYSLPPIEEQKEIVRRVEDKLTALERMLKEIEKQSEKTEVIKQSILASAISGKIY